MCSGSIKAFNIKFLLKFLLTIIVYAIDEKESFDNLESWLDEIKSQTHPYLKIFLIGNKVVLEDKRVIDKAVAEELVKELKIDLFLGTSAKTGYNAQKLFVKAAQILVENFKAFAGIDPRDSIASKDKGSITLTANGNANEGETDDNDKKRKKNVMLKINIYEKNNINKN